MTIIISRPGRGGSTKIAPAPSYSGVISRYADDIRRVLQSEKEAEIRTKVLDWRNGDLSWDDLEDFLDQSIIAEADGTLRKAELEELLFKLGQENTENVKRSKRAKLVADRAEGGISPTEEYEIERDLLELETPGTDEYKVQQANVVDAYEKALEFQVETRRAELLGQFKEGGITLEEELAINKDLQGLAPPESDIYNKLITEEAQILTDIEAEKKRGAGEAEAEAKEKIGGLIEYANLRDEALTREFESGQISGAEAEAEQLTNWQEVLDGFTETGVDQVEGIRRATAEEVVRNLTQSVSQREKGGKFDVEVGGKVASVTLDQILSGQDLGITQPQITFDGQKYHLINPASGEEVGTFTNEKEAQDFARSSGIPGVFNVRDQEGKRQQFALDVDPESATFNMFIRTTEKGEREAFSLIPQNKEQEKRFRKLAGDEIIGKEFRPSAIASLQEKVLGPARQKLFGIGPEGLDVATLRQKAKEKTTGAAQVIGGIAGPGAGLITRAAERVIPEARNRFQDLIADIKPVTERISRTATDIGGRITRAGRELTRPAPLLGFGIAGPIGQIAGAAFSRAKEPIRKVRETISSGFQKAKSFFGGLFNR